MCFQEPYPPYHRYKEGLTPHLVENSIVVIIKPPLFIILRNKSNENNLVYSIFATQKKYLTDNLSTSHTNPRFFIINHSKLSRSNAL